MAPTQATQEKPDQAAQDAEKARKAQEAATAKELKDKERAEAKAKKDAERAEAKAAKAKEREAAKAAKAKERITKVLADLPEDKRPEGDVTIEQARELVKAHKAEERANKPKKASLTLSQRRAVLKLQKSPLRPSTDMNRTPLDYLCSVGLAQATNVETEVERTVKIDNPKASEDGEPAKIDQTTTEKVTVKEYTLTDEGTARAAEINPKWETWKPAA